VTVPAAREPNPISVAAAPAAGRRSTGASRPLLTLGGIGATILEPLRIVHLITGLEAGGAERMLLRLTAGSDRSRFSSTVVSMTAGGLIAGLLAAAGVRVESLGIGRGRADPRGAVRLLRLLRELRPHILQTWLYHADLLGLCARLLGRPPRLLWNIRCTEAICAPALQQLLRCCSTLPDGVVVNSMAGQRFHERLGYRPKRWAYIPNGFDTRELRPDDAARHRLRRELGIADATVTIGMAARYHPMKDHTSFLAAAAELARTRADVVFLLAGAGMTADNRALAAAIADFGLTPRMRLLGERPDIARVYPGFDIATLSSAFGEGCPNALGEAMACGVPCVATDSGDSALLLGDAGIVVARRDPSALAAAWAKLAALPAEARRGLGHHARERIESHYAIGTIVRRYEALYAEIAGADRAPAAVGEAFPRRLLDTRPRLKSGRRNNRLPIQR
jgi:glycosyltransferase involved in cell wall biosynthesis